MLTLFGCQQTPNITTSLNGTDWEFSPTFGDAHSSATAADWKPATVPGVVQTDLFKLGEIPDPFKGNNEDSIKWVSEKNWSYKKEFSIPSEILEKQTHIVRFEGLDTYARILFNDSTTFELSNNAFRTLEIDVSNNLKKNNTLEILLISPDKFEKGEASKLNYQLPEAPRVFTRKPQFQYGWDWGPKIKTMGIWRDVSLISYDAVRLKGVYFRTHNISEEKADLTAHIELGTKDYEKCTVEVINKTTGEIFESPVEVYGDKGIYDLNLSIKNPKLWWTHNLGDPFLYDITVNIKIGTTVVETLSKKIGIRTIELITEKDNVGESFGFKLNGKPVYMKGANYIPQNIFLAEVQPQDREKLLNDAVEANMNMLRVWGGGVYEDDLFYNLCDEKGILVWQDFMFACAMYPGDEFFLRNVKREAIENVKRLRNHPSIALWCGNNENSEGWHRWGWQADKTEVQKEEIWDNYQAVFNDILPKVVDSLHPSVSYWESSPKFGRGDTRYQFEGDAHDWWVWHDGYPFEHFEEEVPRFMSEFGFQSFPSYETIQYFTEQDKIDVSHPSFASHQKHSSGFALIREYMERDFPVPKDDADYVYVSQLLQAYGITKGIRAHRAAKPYNMGTLYWQLNDCWPAVSWSSIDGLGNWKALHYKVKEAFEDLLIITQNDALSVKIMLVNDTFEPVSDTLKFELMEFEGHVFDRREIAITIPPNSSKLVYEYKLPYPKFAMDLTQSFMDISFGNINTIHYFTKPKTLALSPEAIQMKTKKVSEGIEITLKAKTLQKDVFLYADTSGHFTDNFFDLLPGEEKKLLFLVKDATTPSAIGYKTLNGIQQRLKKIQEIK